MTAKAKKNPAADVEAFEARLARLVTEIGGTVCEETLENAVYYARFMVRHGVKNGYSAMAAEAWQLRIRRAQAEVARGLGKVERPAGALNIYGLDTAYFRPRLQRLLQTMNLFSSAEFARECARMARKADPVVLTEDEFQ